MPKSRRRTAADRPAADARGPGPNAARTAGVRAGRPPMPPGFVPDASNPDLLFLLRPDGTTAAAFSARGATAAGIFEAAERDLAEGPSGGRTGSTRDGRRP